jgi:predicted RNA-binding Zn-ribbon protein involved in translation (DUF1610 family)
LTQATIQDLPQTGILLDEGRALPLFECPNCGYEHVTVDCQCPECGDATMCQEGFR